MITGGLAQGVHPNVFRTVAASTDLKTVSGAPKRCACFLLFMNVNAAQQTALFEGPDGIDVTVTVPLQSTVELRGDFSSTLALGSDVTCIAGWIDDGSVQLNA